MNSFSSYKKNKQALLQAIKVFPANQQIVIKRAVALAEKYHAGQTREELGPQKISYVIHCLRAAHWLIKQKVKNSNIITATILHDTLEDTNLSSEKIQNIFGLKTLRLVLSVTRPRPPNETEKQKLRNKSICFRKILKSSQQVRLIKTADLLDNMRSWPYITKNNPLYKKLPRWLNEAEQYYLPIAKSVNQNVVAEMYKIIKKTKNKI
jgi:GTP pyrophosphokinase/guanosine-3',5'-bis(diphosphate) 3'-pyrophosphohydrolase